uniref:hypothetical protein n=1 Tax=Roseovarius indicus TaxID=540747 RepID=UPI003B52D436
MNTNQHLCDTEEVLGQLLNLIDGLKLVQFELSGTPIPDPEDNMKRNAACGLIRATVEKSEEMSQAFEALFKHIEGGLS